MGVLEGGTYVDLEEQPQLTGYRSARSGPEPSVEKVESLIAGLDIIASRISAWLAEGTSPES